MSQKRTYRFPFATYPALRMALLLIAGIALSHIYGGDIPPVHYLGISASFLILWAIFEWSPIVKSDLWKSSLCVAMSCIAIVSFGATLLSLENHRKKTIISSAEPLSMYAWESIQIEGYILSRGRSSSGRNVYEFEVQKTILPEGVIWPSTYRLRIYGVEGAPLIHESHSGAEATVTLYEFPEKRNPHEFDYGKWLLNRGIVAHGELNSVQRSYKIGGISWSGLRQRVLSNVDSLFPDRQAALAKALFIGHKKELTEETRQSFSRAGLSHIMAVSGMHVGFVVAPFWLLIPWLWRWKSGKYLGIVILTTLLISYAGLTGFSASVNRASIMAWLLTYGKLFQKQRHSVNLLAVAALILLIIRPSELFEIGFQLSFSAVLIILLIMPEAQRLIPLRYRFGWQGGLMTVILISIIVQAGLFPILAIYFGEFSIAGPLANALVVPLLGVIVPAGLALSVSGSLLGSGASVIAVPIRWALTWIQEVAHEVGGSDLSFLEVNTMSVWIFPMWLFLVMVIASARLPAIRWKMLILFMVALSLFLADNFMQSVAKDHELTVTALDVGQGDAIHIETPGGKHILVDAGRWSPSGSSGDRVIIPYLEFKGINQLDAVILSHPHADHIGGIPDMIGAIPIHAIYQSGADYDSRIYDRYISLAKQHGIPVKMVEAGDMIDVDPLIRLFVLGPEDGHMARSNVNDMSVVFRLEYGATSFLFTGDAEITQERELMRRYGDFLDTDFLKAGHHGSKTSSTYPFLQYITPEISVTSLAFHNRFSHPHREAVLNLHRIGAKNYFTSLSGALIFSSNGKYIEKVH